MDKNLDLAVKYYQNAVDHGLTWASLDLFDLYWIIKNPKYDARMMSCLDLVTDRHSFRLIDRLGNMYHFGRGVVKDNKLAIKYYRESIKCGCDWSRKYLADALYELGGKKNIAEAIEVLQPLVQKNDVEAKGKIKKFTEKNN